MDAYGYLFKCYAGKASPDYIPSLIGSEINTPHSADAYFERVDISDRHIDTIKVTRWINFDNTDEALLAVKGRSGSYYIPRNELYEIAAANQDDDTIALIERLFPIEA